MPLIPPPIASFNNAQIFGDPNAFTSETLRFPTAGAVDDFLGLEPGTTRYGAEPGGRLWGLTGRFTEPDQSRVQADQQTLLANAGPLRAFGRPTGERFPSNYLYYPNCRFLAEEVAFSPITQVGAGGLWTCTYKMVLRQIGPGPG